MCLAGLSAFLILLDGIMQLAASGEVMHLIMALLMLLIPACGYYGARTKSRDYICCFWCWSFACFMLTFINVIAVLIYLIRGKTDGEDEAPMGSYVVTLVTNLVSSILYLLSFHFGRSLHTNPYSDPHVVTEQMVQT